MQQTITITLGNMAENHKGMQKLGTDDVSPLSCSELIDIGQSLGIMSEYYNLSDDNLPDAGLLVVRDHNINNDGLLEEMLSLDWDKKALMYGKVVNKHARWNLCFSDEAQQPSYEEGKGRVYSWEQVPILSSYRDEISTPKLANLVAEGNHYYNDKCGIGYHGDSERKIVVGIRLGKSMLLSYTWHINGKRMDYQDTIVNLNHGDIYIMSDKAVGYDWKKRKIPTLRHAAGSLI